MFNLSTLQHKGTLSIGHKFDPIDFEGEWSVIFHQRRKQIWRQISASDRPRPGSAEEESGRRLKGSIGLRCAQGRGEGGRDQALVSVQLVEGVD